MEAVTRYGDCFSWTCAPGPVPGSLRLAILGLLEAPQMKRLLIPVAAALLALATLGGCASAGDAPSPSYYQPPMYDVDVSYFYDALSPYGDWIRTEEYGLVWCPAAKPVDWRPYSDGEWIWTDYGWAWVADEEWGWAAFHYGRWYDDVRNGWSWVPGNEWGPGWVAWREGGDWIGWAPMPPEVRWHSSHGFMGTDWDAMPGVQHHWWSFCRTGDLPGRSVNRRLAPRHQAVVLINETHNVTRYTLVNAHVANRSFDVEPIRRASGKDIQVHRIVDVKAPPASRGRQLDQNTFSAYRPQFREAAAGAVPARVLGARPVLTNAERPTPIIVGKRDRQTSEARELGSREAADRQQLERDQRRETAQPPAGVDDATLRRRQQCQQDALDEQSVRDKRVLQSRQDRKKESARENAKVKPVTRGTQKTR